MKVVVAPAAAAVIRGLPPPTKRRIKAAVVALADDPTGVERPGAVKRLRTREPEGGWYRLRVGSWRVVYRVVGQRVEVVRVFPRSEGYGWMDRLGY